MYIYNPDAPNITIYNYNNIYTYRVNFTAPKIYYSFEKSGLWYFLSDGYYNVSFPQVRAIVTFKCMEQLCGDSVKSAS